MPAYLKLSRALLAVALWSQLASACHATIPDQLFACTSHDQCPPSFYCDFVAQRCSHRLSNGIEVAPSAGNAAVGNTNLAGASAGIPTAGYAPPRAGTTAPPRAGNIAAGNAGVSGPPSAAAGSGAVPTAGRTAVAGRASAGAPAVAGAPAPTAGSNAAGAAAPTPVCTLGEKQCQGNQLRECKSDQTGWDTTACDDGCNTSRLDCNACAPNAASCSASTLQTCRGDGSALISTPCDYGCNASRLACNACAPNAATCSASTLQTCRSDGSALISTPCNDGCRPDRPECLSCSSAEHVCAGECVSITSPLACGTTCKVCSTVPNAQTICSAGNCDFTCNTGALRCTNAARGCQALSWSFDVDSEGWNSSVGIDSAHSGEPVASAERTHSGARAIRSDLNVTVGRSRWRMGTGMCGGYPTNIQGRQLQAWIYIASPSSLTGHGCALGGFDDASNPFGAYGTQDTVKVPPNQWTLVTQAASQTAASSATGFGIDCWLDSSTEWTGVLYADDFAVR